MSVWSAAVSQKHAGGMHHYFFLLSQDPRDLSRTSALLQSQSEDVVMAMKADQHPLSVVHTLAFEFQRMSTVSKITAHTEVSIHYL